MLAKRDLLIMTVILSCMCMIPHSIFGMIHEILSLLCYLKERKTATDPSMQTWPSGQFSSDCS